MASAGHGLPAEIAALGGCIGILAKLAQRAKNASPDLQRYHMILYGIHRVTCLMNYFAESSTSAQTLAMSVNGREESIISFCFRGVKSLVSDVKKLTETLEYYTSKKRLAGELLQRIKDFIKKTPSSLSFVINRDHISGLIEAAKHMESSLHHSLSTILLASNEIQTGMTQDMINNLHRSIITQSEKFQDWQQAFNKNNPVVIYFKAKEKPVSKRKSANNSWFRWSSNKSQSTVDTTPNSSNLGQCDLSRTDLSLQTTSSEDLGESVAVVRHKGNFDACHFVGQFPASTEELPQDQADQELPRNQTDQELPRDQTDQHAIILDHRESHNEYESATDDFLFSQSEYFPMTTDNEGSTCSDLICDKSERRLDTSVEAFIDGAIEIARCLRNSNDSFLFCVRTIIVHDENSPVFILQEPCVSNTCDHVSVNANGNIPLEQQPPFLVRLTLQEQEESFPNRGSMDESNLMLTTAPRRREKRPATLVLCQSGRYKQYADGISLNADIALEIQHDESDSDSVDESLDSDDVSDGVADERETVKKSNDERKIVGTPFTRLPCMFCKEDALEPRLDARGSSAFIFASNTSFGYTCQRCKDRTWVSAMEYGLNFIGGAWAWRSN